MAERRRRTGPQVTLKDVAQLAGVHAGTASRALNARTRGLVSANTVERVLDAAGKLDYRPNPIARGLRTNRSYTIGVLIPDIQNPLFPPMVRGIEHTLDQAGYTPLIANTDNDPERERIDLETMLARQVDGLITATARLDHELLNQLAAAGPPLVLINRDTASRALPAALVDDREGIRLAVEHLVELGHQQIAHVAGPQDLSTGRARYEAFREAMKSAGLEPDPRLIAIGEAFTESEGARCCRELFAGRASASAIVAANDLMALGCYDVLAERGLGCPGDVSIVGFNDMPFADRFDPPLTTIRTPQYELGVAAASMLLQALADEPPAPEHIVMEPSLVVRGSTAPKPA